MLEINISNEKQSSISPSPHKQNNKKIIIIFFFLKIIFLNGKKFFLKLFLGKKEE